MVRFTYSMMLEMNKVRNAANSYYLLNTITGDNKEFDYVERFKLNWDLYKGGKLSDTAVGAFHLWVSSFVWTHLQFWSILFTLILLHRVIAKEETLKLTAISNNMLQKQQRLCRTYCAIRSLSALNSKLVDKTWTNNVCTELIWKWKLFKISKLHFNGNVDRKLIDAANLKLVAFNLAEEASNQSQYPNLTKEMIVKLRKSLEVECKGSNVGM